MSFKAAVSKPGYNVLTETSPANFIYSSDYGTLKYATKASVVATILSGEFDAKATYTHSLGYAPYIEVYVDPSGGGDYEYSPYDGSGATVIYGTSYVVKENTIDFFAFSSGVFSDIDFTFLFFIFKNDTGLL